MLYLLHLDDHHLDDLLFVQALGRSLHGAKRPVVLVHGSGGQAERLFEAQGFFPDKQDGRFVNLTPEERPLVEQGVRLANRTLVAKLTDSGVSAVGMHGGDRRLLRRMDGRVVAGDVSWLRSLVSNGAVPVVSALVAGPDAADLAGVDEAISALADAIAPDAAHAVVLTRTERAGLGDPLEAVLAAEELPAHATDLADAAVALRLVAAGMTLLATTIPAFFAPQGPSGTRIDGKKAL